MHDWAYMQPIALRSLPAIAATFLSAALTPWKAQASSSGLNNIPTADTAPHLTLVVQEYSTFGAERKPDHTAGFKFGIDPWEESEWRNRFEWGLDFGPMQKMSEELRTPSYEPANTLVSDRYYDNLSGQQAYKCFACRVRKAGRQG